MAIVAPKESSRINVLREHAQYGDIKSDIVFEFKFDERQNMLDIIEAHNLDDLVKGKSDAETAITLMNWLCQHYKHGNPPRRICEDKPTPQAIMAAADTWENRTNCRGLSLILAQLIRAYNIKAFHITCMPYEEPFDDCHVVVCVYSERLRKLIMLDPTFNLYARNKAGEIIGVDEFRKFMIAGFNVSLNDDSYSHLYGGLDGYKEYMTKNLVRIERSAVNGYGLDTEEGSVVLLSENYMQNEAKSFPSDEQAAFITSREYFWQV